MNTITLVISVAIVVAAVWVYNRLIQSRNRTDAAWSDIDVQLQRRHDLIPQLVTAVDQYAKYEKATLEAVTSLRAEAKQAVGIRSKGKLEEKLSAGVHRIIALAESYPDLKANENFLNLQHELVETENYLQFARRYYNGAVRDFNNQVAMFPSNLIASLFKFNERDFFQKTADEAANVPLVEFGKIE